MLSKIFSNPSSSSGEAGWELLVPTLAESSIGQRSAITGLFQLKPSRVFKGSKKLHVGRGSFLARTREQSEHICVHHQTVTARKVSPLGTSGVKSHYIDSRCRVEPSNFLNRLITFASRAWMVFTSSQSRKEDGGHELSHQYSPHGPKTSR
jgi:hypothetical protein